MAVLAALHVPRLWITALAYCTWGMSLLETSSCGSTGCTACAKVMDHSISLLHLGYASARDF